MDSIISEQRICHVDALSHDSSDRQFGGFSGCDALGIFGLEDWVKADADECRHVEGLLDRTVGGGFARRADLL